MPSGDGVTESAFMAQRWKGSQGGPPKGKSAVAPKPGAREARMRWVQRSSPWAMPSARSGEALKAGHMAPPKFPSSRIVPGGPPWLPFQRWAMKADSVAPSPLGILIHPDYGLWHAYRGAFAFVERLPLPPREQRPSPCDSCIERPCLSACPVGAFTPGRYDVARCRDHVAGPAGRACREEGCLARLACPIGRAHAYPAAEMAFHMAAFLAGR